MAIVFHCSGCDQELRAKDDAAGKRARCPKCGAVTEIPAPAAEEPLEYRMTDEPLPVAMRAEAGVGAPGAAATAGTRPCPYCGEPIRMTASKCKWCGEFLETPHAAAAAHGYGATGAVEQRRRIAARRLRPPAICLVVCASLGLLASIYNVYHALTQPPPPVNPNANDFVKGFAQGMVGPTAAIIQTVFAFVNLLILLGAISMLQFRAYGFAMTAAILAMVNFGSLCCVLGLPFGIWTIVVLSGSEVRAAFR